MSAKHDDWARLQEIYDVVRETRIQMEQIGFTKERFLDPENAQDDLISEGLMNRVFRVTEEVGHLSDEVARRYGFDRQGVLGVRNRLAHAYGGGRPRDHLVGDRGGFRRTARCVQTVLRRQQHRA